MKAYLDYAATTPVNNRFIEDVSWYLQHKFYNPSSAYADAADVKRDMEDARMQVALSINADPSEIIFTSGATEANNMVISNFICDYIIASPYEHPSVMRAVDNIGLQVDDLDFHPSLLTYMMANNEVGFIQNVKQIAKTAHDNGALIHTDATQAYGHIPIDVKDLDVDYMTVSFHKCGCAKGIGFLYVKDGCRLDPLAYGGGQERGLRPGTENTAYIYAAGKHVECLFKHGIVPDYTLRDRLKAGLKGIHINETEHQLPNILSITVDGIRSDQLVAMMDERGIMISAGSACHAGDPRPSETLLAFGLTEEQALSTIRVSWGTETTIDEINYFIKTLKNCVGLYRDDD